MKWGVISFRQLGQEGRWDAGFHLLLNELRSERDFIASKLTADEAREWLGRMELTDKAPLLVLSRQGNPILSAKTIEAIEKEYPHLALTVMQTNIARLVARAREAEAKAGAYAEQILAFAATLKS